MAPNTLAVDFLSKPAPNVTKKYVDWSTTKLLEYEGFYAVVLDNVMSQSECEQLTEAAVAQAGGKWEPALINTGNYQQALYTDVRNNDRIMWDDTEVVAKIWKRVEPHLPELQSIKNQADVMGNGPVKRGEIWDFSCLNERMRFLQYGPGEYFKEHCDGTFERRDGSERSMYTLHLYLNERTEENPMLGGATTFHSLRNPWQQDKDYDVYPRVGRVLIFQHRNLMHSGAEVESGLKLTLRTDLMFKKRKELLPEEERAGVVLGSGPKRQYASRS